MHLVAYVLMLVVVGASAANLTELPTTPGTETGTGTGTGTESHLCSLICFPTIRVAPFFETPQDGILATVVKRCNVTSSSGQNHCELSTANLLKEFTVDQRSSPSVQLYVRLVCNANTTNDRLRLKMVNRPGVSIKRFISYLHLVECDGALPDFAAFGEATDMRVLILINWNEILDPDQNVPGENDTLSIIPGLENVGTLTVAQIKPIRQGIPRGFVDNLWPRMAEVDFRNLSMTDEDVVGLRRSMPILQSLQCDFNNFTVPPAFPWYQPTLKLPRNLSRTPSGNQHYAHSMGVDIARNIYRRSLDISHNNVRDLSSFEFHGSLAVLTMTHNGLRSIGPHCFRNLTDLQSLRMSYNDLMTLPDGLLDGMVLLRELHLDHNQLVSLTQRHFHGVPNLKKLYINHNNLVRLGSKLFLPTADLEIIDMSNNQLQSVPPDAVGVNMPHLAVLNLNHNNLTHLPAFLFTTRTLRSIDLSFNSISFVTFLESLDLMYADVIVHHNRESASTLNFAFKPLYHKTVNFRHNNFTQLDYSLVTSYSNERALTFRTILNFFTLDLEDNDINCDCKTYNLYTFFQEQRKQPQTEQYSLPKVGAYYYESWKCARPSVSAGKAIADVSNRTFMCREELEDCPSGCDCNVLSVDNSVSVNCSNRNLTELPTTVPNNTESLLIRNNFISALTVSHPYMSKLKTLDLSDNKISTIEAKFLSGLKSLKRIYVHNNHLTTLPKVVKNAWNFKATLSGNIFKCDCHATWLQKWMYSRRANILDVDTVLCSSGRPQGQILIFANIDDFVCEVSDQVIKTVAITLGVILGLLVLVSIPAYKYRGEVKVFLYVHFKWHPFDKNDDSDVIEKLYDAFVSYSGYDYDWVINILRPMLETAEMPYRLCIHDRDFMCGAAIQENILNSVKYSRRMILLVTHRFLESEWCLLEFRAAHERVLRDRTNYLIVVLFDDINIDDLDDDLKLYLRTNTYLSVSNKWFWQKLFYAMPEKPLAKIRGEVLPPGGFRTLVPLPESLEAYTQSSKNTVQQEHRDVISDDVTVPISDELIETRADHQVQQEKPGSKDLKLIETRADHQIQQEKPDSKDMKLTETGHDFIYTVGEYDSLDRLNMQDKLGRDLSLESEDSGVESIIQ